MTDGQFIEKGTLDYWTDRDRDQRDKIKALEAENRELAMQLLAAHGQAQEALERATKAETELAEARRHLNNMLYWADESTHGLNDLPAKFREDYNAAAVFLDGDDDNG